MATTLCFDFGNTRLKCAVFSNGKLEALVVLDDTSEQTIKAIIKKYQPQKSILSSVVKHDEMIEIGRAHV